MRKLPEHILWVDLETTGSREGDTIIEVGAVLTNKQLDVQGTFSRVAYYPKAGIHFVDPFVQEMHTKNGLWNDCANQLPDLTIAAIDSEMARWLKYQARSSEHVALAGSGVSHFDRRYIKKEMPLTDALLTYWALDVGVVRRFLQLWGQEDKIPTAGDSDTKTHRALDDALQHLEEAKHYGLAFGN